MLSLFNLNSEVKTQRHRSKKSSIWKISKNYKAVDTHLSEALRLKTLQFLKSYPY